MQQAIQALQRDLAAFRAGRPTPDLLSRVKAMYYDNPTPLHEMASVTVEGASALVIRPWEKRFLGDIEKAIMEANLNLTPVNDGEVVRVPVPAPTNERRQELVKQAKQRCEEAKVTVRNERRDANDSVKAATKEGDLSQDEEKRSLKQIQEMTDDFVKQIDALFEKKQQEILSI